MSTIDRKAAIRAYKDNPPPMGVFCIRNTAAGKAFVGSSPNVAAALNRQRFQLDHGSHPNRALQKDWSELGPEAFTFETLDTLEVKDPPAADPAADLVALDSMWRENVSQSAVLYD